GAAGLGDLAAHAHQVADLHGVARVVRVAGHVAVAVVDLDHVAVARTRAGEADHAIGHRQHRVAGTGVEVDALVPGGAATEGIGAAAEAGGDVARRHRRARRHRVAVELAV